MEHTRTPHLTARLQGFGTTVFSEMSALAARHDAVNLGQGFPDFDPPQALAEAARQAISDGHNQYAPGNGVPALRRAVADHATMHQGVTYDPETEVTIATGATEGVVATLQALLDVGDEVVVFAPVYDVYPAAVAMAGGSLRTVPLRQDPDGVWGFDDEDLAAAVGPRTRVILLNTPHNPTGKVFSVEELRRIATVAIAADVVVVTDEVYEHLVFDGLPHTTMAAVDGMRDRTVRVSSAGKTFSVTGWKVGWVCAAPPLTQAVRAAKQWITFTSGTPLQHALAPALTWGEAFTTPLAAQYQAARDLLCDGLSELGLDVTRPQGSYFVTVDVRDLGFDDDVAFCRTLPQQVGVAAIPLSGFFTDPRDGRGLVRFAFCKSQAMIAEGIARLATGLPTLPRT